MSEIDFIAKPEDLTINLCHNKAPLFAIRYVPVKEGVKPMYLKLPVRRWSCSKNVSFTRDVGEDSQNGVNFALFKQEDVATTALLKLSLIGKSRRRDIGDYEIQKLGDFNYAPIYTICRRINPDWVKRGITFSMLHYREYDDMETAKTYSESMTYYGSQVSIKPTDYIRIKNSQWRSFGDELREVDVCVFDIMQIYHIIYHPQYPWTDCYNEYYAHYDRYWEYNFLVDKFGINNMAVGEEKVVSGAVDSIKSIDYKHGKHREFGIDFGFLDHDPFLEYVIKRVEPSQIGA